ncbi:MAG: ABC transporter ATP-binding protein [Firmicutes bacterium]|nr:ABC transporter ATP-binding protein [Bacillota bacterium]
MVPAVEMRNINKTFPGVAANRDINLQVMPGEIHAILGENGAGKTTLMSILAGLYHPDSGQIWIKGHRVVLKSPFHALQAGVGMIYQHFKLVLPLTVAENIALGDRRIKRFFSKKRLEQSAADIIKEYGIELDPRQVAQQLSLGELQRLEIIRVLHRGCEVLILDEPTAVLTPAEASELYALLKKLAQAGKTSILITHKLNEVMEVADKVTILRRGEMVGTFSTSATSVSTLASLMIGREYNLDEKGPPFRGTSTPFLKAQDISIIGNRGNQAVSGADLDLRRGEILAIAGVAGNGQRELLEGLAGMRRIVSGRVTLDDKDITDRSVRELQQMGIRMACEDRMGMGLVGEFGITDNLILRDYYRESYGRGFWLDYQSISRRAARVVEKFNLQPPDLNRPVKLMSGGNQQKLMLAREIEENPAVIIAAYPTRGLDIAAIEAVYHMLWKEKERGAAILLVMEDLDEIMRVADRVAVMYRGRLSPAYDTGEIKIEELGRLMAGLDRGDRDEAN